MMNRAKLLLKRNIEVTSDILRKDKAQRSPQYTAELEDDLREYIVALQVLDSLSQGEPTIRRITLISKV